MDLLLSTHDTGFERPDAATIARVLASLDGGRNLVATLGTSDSTYLQATGGAATGFGLDLQEGSLERRFRSRDRALPLAWVTEAFQRYAAGDLAWRDEVAWEAERIEVAPESWFNTWPAYIALLVGVSVGMWLFHSWLAGGG
jgi:hypothetical protein